MGLGLGFRVEGILSIGLMQLKDDESRGAFKDVISASIPCVP